MQFFYPPFGAKDRPNRGFLTINLSGLDQRQYCLIHPYRKLNIIAPVESVPPWGISSPLNLDNEPLSC